MIYGGKSANNQCIFTKLSRGGYAPAQYSTAVCGGVHVSNLCVEVGSTTAAAVI